MEQMGLLAPDTCAASARLYSNRKFTIPLVRGVTDRLKYIHL